MDPARTIATTIVTNPIVTPVPNLLWSAVGAGFFFNKHWRRLEIYTNPENFPLLVAGYGLAKAAEGTWLYKAVAITAVTMYVSNRIFDCINQSIALSHAYEQLVNTVKGNYVVYSKPDWNKTSLVSMSGWSDAKRVAFALANVIVEFLKLSGTLVNLWQACKDSEKDEKMLIAEMFVNARESMEKFIANQQRLKTQLETNKPVVQQMLLKIGIKDPKKADALIDNVSQSMEYAAKGVQAINVTSKAVTNVAQGVVYAAADMFGATKHLPSAFVPPSPLANSKVNLVTPQQPIQRKLIFT